MIIVIALVEGLVNIVNANGILVVTVGDVTILDVLIVVIVIVIVALNKGLVVAITPP